MKSPTPAAPHLLFEIAAHRFALRTDTVAEVLPLPELLRPPGLPAAVAGLLDFGGEVVAVVRTGSLLDLPADEPGLYCHLLLLRMPPPRPALLVDRVSAVERIATTALRPVDDGNSFRGYVLAEANVGEHRVHVLSTERLLTEAERRRLADYAVIEERRSVALEPVG